jgi:hypothetical protein
MIRWFLIHGQPKQYWDLTAAAEYCGVSRSLFVSHYRDGKIWKPTKSSGKKRYYSDERLAKVKEYWDRWHIKKWTQADVTRLLGLSPIVLYWAV